MPDGAPARRRARGARPRAGAGAHRHRAAEQRRHPVAGELAHGRAPGQPLSPRRGRPTARDLWVAVESVHAVTYFAPECRAALARRRAARLLVGLLRRPGRPARPRRPRPGDRGLLQLPPGHGGPGRARRAGTTVAPETLCRVRAIAAAEALGEVCRVECPLRSAGRAAAPATGRGGLRRRGTGPGGGQPVALAPHRHRARDRRARRGLAGLHDPARAPRRRACGGAGRPRPQRRARRTCWPPGPRRSPSRCCGTTEAGARRNGTRPTAALAARGLLHARRARHRRRPHPARPRSRSSPTSWPSRPTPRLSDRALEELHGALGACAADVAASGLLPFPNPMGLPRLAERLGRRARRRPAGHEPELLAQLAGRHHLAGVAHGSGSSPSQAATSPATSGGAGTCPAPDEHLVHARGPHGLGQGEAGRDGEGRRCPGPRTPRGTCR